MIILSQSDHVTLRGDLKAAAAADFDVGTFEFGQQRAISLEHGHVEAVAVRVADEHVAGVGNIDTVGKVGDVLASDAPKKLTLLRRRRKSEK